MEEVKKEIKKEWYKRWYSKVILVVAGLLVLINIFGSNDKDKITEVKPIQPSQETTIPEPIATKATTKVQPQVQPKQEETTPASNKSYQQIFTFSGNGVKKSEPFTITGSRFKINYDCSGEFCQAFLYHAGGNMEGIIYNSMDQVKDETIFYGSGEYYIDSNSIGNFKMTVSDYK